MKCLLFLFMSFGYAFIIINYLVKVVTFYFCLMFPLPPQNSTIPGFIITESENGVASPKQTRLGKNLNYLFLWVLRRLCVNIYCSITWLFIILQAIRDKKRKDDAKNEVILHQISGESSNSYCSRLLGCWIFNLDKWSIDITTKNINWAEECC